MARKEMNKERYCSICSGKLEEGNPTDICYCYQSIMANINMGSQGFKEKILGEFGNELVKNYINNC
jgi:hypothetical protein